MDFYEDDAISGDARPSRAGNGKDSFVKAMAREKGSRPDPVNDIDADRRRTGSKPPGLLRRWLAGVRDRFFKFLLGDDIFISYSRADGAGYAAALADKLAERGFSCRFDQWGTESGSEMPDSLKRSLRRSAALVLVGTRGAAESLHVAEEVREIKKRRRMIIPIVFEGVLLVGGWTPRDGRLVRLKSFEESDPRRLDMQEAVWGKEVEGLPIHCQKSDNSLTTELLSRVEKTCDFWKKDKRLRIGSAILTLLLALLMGASVWAGEVAVRKTREANLASEKAVEQTRLAEQKTKEAEAATQKAADAEEIARAKTKEANDAETTVRLKTKEAEAAAKRADEQTRIANAAAEKAATAETTARLKTQEASEATRRAEEQTRVADAATSRASIASAEADKQQGIALGRQVSTLADFRREQSLQLGEAWADAFQQSVLFSIDAAKRLSELGIQPADSGRSLRDSLSLLPRSAKPFLHDHEVMGAILTPDGRYLLTKEDDHRVRIWESESHTLKGEVENDGELVLNPGRTLMAAVQSDGRLKVWGLPDGRLLWEKDNQSQYHYLQFSAGGEYLVAGVSVRSVGGDAPAGRVVVWHTADGRPFTEIGYKGYLMGVAICSSKNLLAFSLTPPQKRKAGGAQTENFLQIWQMSSPASTRLSETAVPQKPGPKAPDGYSVYGPLSDLIFSPDGMLLAANTGYHASILNVGTGAEVVYIPGPDRDPTQERGNNVEELERLEFSPDGKYLGTRGHHGTVNTWDVATGGQIWGGNELLPEREQDYWQQPYLVTGKAGGVRVLDIWTGREVTRVLNGEEVERGDYAARGSRLVLYKGKQVWLYDTGSAQEAAHATLPFNADLSYDNGSRGPKYIAATSGKEVTVWDAVEARQVALLRHRDKVYGNVLLSPTGTYAATVTWDSVVHLWDIHTGQEAWARPTPPITAKNEDVDPDEEPQLDWTIVGFRYSPNGKYLALETGTEGKGTVLCLWEAGSGEEVLRTPIGDEFSNKLFFTSDEAFALIEGDNTLRVLNIAGGGHSDLPLESYGVKLAFNAGKGLIARSIDQGINVSQISGAIRPYELGGLGKYPDFAFSPDGKYLVVAGGDNRTKGRIIEAETNHDVVPPFDFAGSVRGIRFSPSGKYALTDVETALNKWDLYVWELRNGREVAHLHTEGLIFRTVFSPDERRVAVVVFRSPTIYVLTLEGEVGQKELFNDGPVDRVVFSADGGNLAALRENWVHTWEMGSWREMARLKHDRALTLATFADGGSKLATLSEDHTIRLWILPETDLVTRACERVPRNFSAEEWRRYFPADKYRPTCPNLPTPSDAKKGSGN